MHECYLHRHQGGETKLIRLVPESVIDRAPARGEIDAMRWYHTLNLPGGIVTPGEYDLRPVLSRLPIPPALDGKRCIDVGSRDGFYAFEMERRGAAEVVSIDIDDPAELHLPATVKSDPTAIKTELEDGHRAFDAARSALGSQVRREMVSVYRLDPETHGTFDFGVIGTLLLHLRDPVGALTAIRGVVTGELLINDAVMVGLATYRRRPIAELYMEGGPFWWLCNPSALKRMAEAAGFRIVSAGRPYLVPHGAGPLTFKPGIRGPLGRLPRRLIQRRGSPHVWILGAAA
jgi:SAM-dependent methyltransferase